jgi:hypothetical protein
MAKTLSDTGVQEQVIARIQALRPETNRLWGKMNAGQMVCHLSDGFRMALGTRTGPDVSNLMSRTFVRWFALQVPLTWPKGVKTTDAADQMIGGSRPSEFTRDREDLVGLVQLFLESHKFAPHPMFGTMSRVEWMRWGWLHTDHHLRQFGL